MNKKINSILALIIGSCGALAVQVYGTFDSTLVQPEESCRGGMWIKV